MYCYSDLTMYVCTNNTLLVNIYYISFNDPTLLIFLIMYLFLCLQRTEGQPGKRWTWRRCTTAAADHAGQEPWHLQGEKYGHKCMHYNFMLLLKFNNYFYIYIKNVSFFFKDVMQQPMVPPFKITQNSMHSPAQSANFQPAAMSPNPSRCVWPHDWAQNY